MADVEKLVKLVGPFTGELNRNHNHNTEVENLVGNEDRRSFLL